MSSELRFPRKRTLVSYTASLLSDALVFVVGGYNGYTTYVAPSFFYVVSRSWVFFDSMNIAREAHTASSLSD